MKYTWYCEKYTKITLYKFHNMGNKVIEID